MVVHSDMPDSHDYTILLNGEDVSRYCFLADDNYNFVILLVPFSRIKADAPKKMHAIFPDIGVQIDSALYEKREGHVEILSSAGRPEEAARLCL